MLGVLVDEASPCEFREDVPADEPLAHKVGIDPPHVAVGWGKLKGLGNPFLLWLGSLQWLALLSTQEHGHGLRVGKVVEPLDKGHRAAALLDGVVVPAVAPDGDGVVPFEPLLRPGANEFLALGEEEPFQIHLTGPELLLVCEIDVGHFNTSKA